MCNMVTQSLNYRIKYPAPNDFFKIIVVPAQCSLVLILPYLCPEESSLYNALYFCYFPFHFLACSSFEYYEGENYSLLGSKITQ